MNEQSIKLRTMLNILDKDKENTVDRTLSDNQIEIYNEGYRKGAQESAQRALTLLESMTPRQLDYLHTLLQDAEATHDID